MLSIVKTEAEPFEHLDITFISIHYFHSVVTATGSVARLIPIFTVLMLGIKDRHTIYTSRTISMQSFEIYCIQFGAN